MGEMEGRQDPPVRGLVKPYGKDSAARTDLALGKREGIGYEEEQYGCDQQPYCVSVHIKND